jgi:hypothetical protein
MRLYAICSDPLCRDWREYDSVFWRLPYVWCRLCGGNAIFKCPRCGRRIHEKSWNATAKCQGCGFPLIADGNPRLVAGSIAYLGPLAKASASGSRHIGCLDWPVPPRIAACTSSDCRHVVIFSADELHGWLLDYLSRPVGACPKCTSAQVRSCPKCGAGRYEFPVEWPFHCLECGVTLVGTELSKFPAKILTQRRARKQPRANPTAREDRARENRAPGSS